MRIVVLLVSILLGATAGVAVADWRDDPVASTPAAQDPLHLGVPLVNLDCDQRSIQILRASDSQAALQSAVSDHPNAKYLATGDSCDTVYEETTDPTPPYVVYEGPYDTVAQPCRQRMDASGRGTVVTRLVEGKTDLVKCLCVLPLLDHEDEWPDLELGVVLSPSEELYLRQLQQMLIDRGVLEADKPSGQYDEETVTAVNEFLTGRGELPDGIVDTETWQLVRRHLCEYDF
jgi:hypothetical protein